MRRRVGIALCALLALLPVAASARTLDWEELAVAARLDADGNLHIQERQAMVFDGDWNGGERQFRLQGDQKIELHGMTRIDPATGTSIEMRKGSLDRVDNYDWTDRMTLRWRARLPTDPAFDDEVIVYVLDYTVKGAIEKKWGDYVLDHDFAFPDRYGTIERFTLDLEIDPAWRPQSAIESRHEIENMVPGRSYVVTTRLDYVGPGRPKGVFVPPPLGIRAPLVGAALAIVVVLFMRFRRWERDQGRYEPPDMPAAPGRAWFEEHLLSMSPEVVGVLWDRTVSAPEVSALLARLVAEGKLASRVEEVPGNWKKDILHLELLAPREEFEDYEAKLIDKLFFDDRTKTSTEAVREHYKKRGFSPSSTIATKLLKETRKLPGFKRKMPAPAKKPGLIMLASVLALGLLELVTRGAGAAALFATLAVATVLPAIVGFVGVNWRQRKADELLVPTLLFLVPLGFILAGLWMPVLIGQILFPLPIKMSWLGMAALLLWGVAIANSFFNNARTRDSKEAVTTRKRLAAIRDYFRLELTKPAPDLEDDWFPYLLAFGLAKNVDKWSVAYASTSDFSTSRTGSFSGGSAGSGWSGGGGRFGGAGASAGWAAAATGLAAGVASPSSGGSGGGGGGGGGSSGGGGGGGW